MKAGGPENMGIDGNIFVGAILQLAVTLSSTAEGQQGQDPQPDVRLAVMHCLQAAEGRARSSLPFLPAPPLCFMLAQLAGRIMASFAAAPEAASAASLLLPSVNTFLDATIGRVPVCAHELSRVRRSLLASVQLLLQGPSLLLSAAGVAAGGPVLVCEAASSALCAINTAVLLKGDGASDITSRPNAQLLQQCLALLADPTISAQLKELWRYPLCSVQRAQPVTCATQIARAANAALGSAIHSMRSITNPMHVRLQPPIMKLLADFQHLVLALSAAVAQPTFLKWSEGGLLTKPTPRIYEASSLLADIAMLSAAALNDNPSSVCQSAGLACAVASAAVSALAFWELDSSSGSRPPDVADKMASCMHYTAQAAKYMHLLAQQLSKASNANAEAARSALTTRGAAQSLVRLLLWLSEPTTAVATASGVLAEALPALQLMAADEDMRQVLALPGGPHDWEPLAAALRRRLPRRMAARLLPEVDCVSAAVVGHASDAPGSVAADDAAIAAAEAAMSQLLQVRIVIFG